MRTRKPRLRNKAILKGKHYMPNTKLQVKLGIRSIIAILIFALAYIIVQNTNNIFAYFQSQDFLINEFSIQYRTVTYEYYVYDENGNSSELQASTTRQILPTEIITLTPEGSLSNDNTYLLKFDIESTEYNANDTYTMPNRDITITENYYKRKFKVSFDANGGTGTMIDQNFVYGVAQNLTQNTFTNSGLIFAGWNTSADGSGTTYTDEQSVSNLTEVYDGTVTLYAQWGSGVARIGSTYYSTLQDAVNDVPDDGTLTIVELLEDVAEDINVASGQNIKFSLHDHTITHVKTAETNDLATFDIYGTVEICDGIIIDNDNTTATINVYEGGVLNVTGGQIISTATKGKQAVYNFGGTVNISGGYMENSSKASVAGGDVRGAVHNKSGTMVITGGTIVSKNYVGVQNESALTIGVQDNDPDHSTPTIQGATYGISNNIRGGNKPSGAVKNCYIYNGTISGKTAAFDDETKITGTEAGYVLTHSGETIGGESYVSAYLATDVKTVTFDPNGGQVNETSRAVEVNHAIGTLPVPTSTSSNFLGWYTDPDAGTQITPDMVVTDNITVFAHWQNVAVCSVNGVEYSSLNTAIQNATNNTQTTITMIKDLEITSGNKISVASNKNIVLDMNGHTFQFAGTQATPLIENNGRLEIVGGTLISSTTQGIINNKNGTLTVNGTTITATGTRQAIYAEKGTVNITGGAVLTSAATERATVQTLANATMNIIDATITSSNFAGVENAGTVNIGTADENIDVSTPTIQGSTYGVKSSGTFNFYDGTLKGKTDAIDGNVNGKETNSQIVPGTENIGGETYTTAHLEINP